VTEPNDFPESEFCLSVVFLPLVESSLIMDGSLLYSNQLRHKSSSTSTIPTDVFSKEFGSPGSQVLLGISNKNKNSE
jgi:hypothetical protein